MTLMDTSTVSQLNHLQSLIAARAANAQATADYLSACGDKLPENRRKELQSHFNELTASLCELNADYARLSSSPCNQKQPFNFN